MKQQLLYFITFCSLGLLNPISNYASEALTPNFIFIVTDDHRYDLLGCNGNEIIQTPHIDRLASDGVRFTNAHVSSAICMPSRVSMLLGQFERKHGVNFNSGTAVSVEAWNQSYPVVLRQNGYYTGYIGKNHAPIGVGGYKSGVMEASFDYWYGAHGQLSFYSKEKYPIFEGAVSHTQAEILQEGVDDFFNNEYRLEGAQHFLEQRPVDKPFCLNICFNLPHGASTSRMELREEDDEIYRTLYRDQDVPLSKHYIQKEDVQTPKIPSDVFMTDALQLGYQFVYKEDTVRERIIRHMQAVTGVDRLIGKLRKTLEEQGLDQNTIIVFTSDHGLFFGEFGIAGKALCYEMCTKVPFIVYNPFASEDARGVVSHELVQTIDVASTFMDFAEIEAPESFQGKSIRPLLEGKSDHVHDYLFSENLWSTTFGNPRCEAVQNKEWKYIRYYRNDNIPSYEKMEIADQLGISRFDMLYRYHASDLATYRNYIESPLRGEQPVYEELYHLSVDPDETTNLAELNRYEYQLKSMRIIWKEKILQARGTGKPQVLRHLIDVD